MPKYTQPRKTWQYTQELKAKAVQLSLMEGVQVKRRSPYEVHEIRGKVNNALYFHKNTYQNYSAKIFPYSAKLPTGYLAFFQSQLLLCLF